MSDKEIIQHVLSHNYTKDTAYYRELIASFGYIPSLMDITLENKKGYILLHMKYYLDKDQFTKAKQSIRFGSITLQMFNGYPEPKIIAIATLKIDPYKVGLDSPFIDYDMTKLDFYQAVTEHGGYNTRKLVTNTSKDGASITSDTDARKHEHGSRNTIT